MPITTVTVEVYCCYAQVDETWQRKLETHLSLLKQLGLISLWHNRRITPGTDWAKSIDTHLETASVILLLVSADFLASGYCYGIEMKRALERHTANEARVVPILVRPVDWKNAPFAHLQVLPTNAKPLVMWKNQESAFTAVATSLRDLLEESSSAVPPAPLGVWNVPYLRNPYFTGRDELLDRLHQQLLLQAQGDPTTTHWAALTQPQAIKGLGGIGKTQIAIEYAYRSREKGDYTHTFWVNAASEEALLTSFVTIAELLPAFPAKNESDQRKLVKAIKRWLEQCQERWLLIFDNADDIALVSEYLPHQGLGSILLTTRAYAVGSLASSIEVETMSFIEGTYLLLRRAGRFDHTSDEEINQAGNIVVALDHFPLALDQAGAYIEETKCSLIDYLNVYQNHRKELLAWRGTQATHYPDSVATTWLISFQKVQKASQAAADLLYLCAFLHPDAIPIEIIAEGGSTLGPNLEPVTKHQQLLDAAIAVLKVYSLIRLNSDKNTLSIHRLVQAVLQDQLEADAWQIWAKRTVMVVNASFPSVEFSSWIRCERYLPHALLCASWIERTEMIFPEAVRLLNQTGLYLAERARYTEAEPLFQRALMVQEQLLGPEHPDTAASFHNLAALYMKQGKYEEAEPLYRHALAIQESQSGLEHPDTVAGLNNLAGLYYAQGKYEEAELLFQRALHIREQQLGPEHIQVASLLNNLATLYYARGRYAEAEMLYHRVLAIREQQLGATHPDTAVSLSNLASLYMEQSKYAEAEPLYQRALAIREQQLGAEHPSTAISLSNLASLYTEQGTFELAEPLYQRTLAIYEQQLGATHPDTAVSLSNLASLYMKQGRYEEAEPLYQRALAIREQQLGAEHPSTAISLSNLGSLLYQMGRYTEAENFLRRALEIDQLTLGDNHPTVGVRLTNLSLMLSALGRDEEAEQVLQQTEHLLGKRISTFIQEREES